MFAGLRVQGDQPDLVMAAYREYSPSLGRWLSEDPIRLHKWIPELLRIVDSRPLTAVDPSGLVRWDVDTNVHYVETTMLGAAAACKVTNPICGCTTATLGVGGSCECVGGVFKMSLSISYKNPTIYIARDAWTPMWLIRRHEEAHVVDDMSPAEREDHRWGTRSEGLPQSPGLRAGA